MKIAIASDHAGFEMKEFAKNFLQDSGYDVLDLGTNDCSSVDYPSFADKMADNVSLIGKVSSTLGAVESQVSNIGPEFEALAVGVEEEAEFAVQISQTIRDMSVSALQTRNEIVELKQAADFIDDSSEDLKSKMAHFNLGD